MVDKLKKFIKKEAYLFPVIVCLFFVPLFFNPFFINSFTQGKEIFFKLVMFISLLGISIYWLLQKSFKVKSFLKSPLFLFLMAASFFAIISTLLSPTPLISFFGTYHRGFGLFTQAYLLCFIVYCASVLTEEDVLKLLKYVFVIAVFISLYGLLQKVGFDPFFGNYNKNVFVGRIFSSLGNPGYFGQYMLLCIGIGTFFVFEEKEKARKLLYSIGLAMVLAALWFSQTRTSMLALGLCFVLFAAKYWKNIGIFLRKMTRNQKVGSFFIILGVIVGLVLLPKAHFSLNEDSLRSLNSRMEIWKGATSLIMKRPLFGYGQETFYVYSPEIITKQFLTMEEDLNLTIDRIHNELLETTFSGGVFAGIAYLLFFGFLVWAFFKGKNPISSLLLLIVIANILQNQFSFSDISINILVGFCLGGLVADELRKRKIKTVKLSKNLRYVAFATVLIIGISTFEQTIFKPFFSQLAYAASQYSYDKSYEIAVTEHKKAIIYAPNHSELWYELMFLDPSSMPRALENIERIEGQSGNLLAWKGNYYAEKDPQKASEYFMQALEKNPYYPNWIRSYADMLYKNGDYENALFLYRQYLEAAPDFWKWKDNLAEHSPKEQTSYRIFFKNVPDFWNTVTRVNELENALEQKN